MYGPIRDLDLPINKQCMSFGHDLNVWLTLSVMTNRGTAYILYNDASNAEAAIAHMHEAQLDGAVISVSVALPRRKFSQSPPPARRGPPVFDRFEPRAPPPGGYRGGLPLQGYGGIANDRYRSSPSIPRRNSPPRRYGTRNAPWERDLDTYRPRSYSRSRSPRTRSRSLSSRSRSRSPGRRDRGFVRRESPPPSSRGRKRRSPSYSSFSSYSDRSRSRSRGRYRRGRN